MERSKIPLNKWLLVMHLMMAGKKGISALQVHRMLGISYQTAWFMCHRLREGMRDMELRRGVVPPPGVASWARQS
jgi:hypothetical protein